MVDVSTFLDIAKGIYNALPTITMIILFVVAFGVYVSFYQTHFTAWDRWMMTTLAFDILRAGLFLVLSMQSVQDFTGTQPSQFLALMCALILAGIFFCIQKKLEWFASALALFLVFFVIYMLFFGELPWYFILVAPAAFLVIYAACLRYHGVMWIRFTGQSILCSYSAVYSVTLIITGGGLELAITDIVSPTQCVAAHICILRLVLVVVLTLLRLAISYCLRERADRHRVNAETGALDARIEQHITRHATTAALHRPRLTGPDASAATDAPASERDVILPPSRPRSEDIEIANVRASV